MKPVIFCLFSPPSPIRSIIIDRLVSQILFICLFCFLQQFLFLFINGLFIVLIITINRFFILLPRTIIAAVPMVLTHYGAEGK